jgi:tuftelin-interacting protein 11
MGRRKRVLDDGDDSDSNDTSDVPDFDFDNDPDAREERALFENPYRNKRRRTNGKEDTLYGIFAENSDEEDGPRRGTASRVKRSDWSKAPAFVTGDKPVKLEESMAVDPDNAKDDGSSGNSNNEEDVDGEDDESEAEDEPREDAEYSDDSEPPRAPSPRVRIEDEEFEESQPKYRLGGIGSTAKRNHEAPSFSSGADVGPSQVGQQFSGFSRGGIGSQKPKGFPAEQDALPFLSNSTFATPSAFASRSQSFNRATNDSPKPVALPTAEIAHFNKLQGSFGARMLSKMGWQAGTGLGTTGDGIVIPIESKLRPQKMGIAFKGFKEKTEQSKLEAKRRGELVSDEEDEKTKKFRKKAKEQQQKRSDAWKRPKKVKTKTEHKTYEQILAEAGEAVSAPGIGQIIDATGAVVRHIFLGDIKLL